jgi:GNAT superfamily N-acetyltransferase
VDQPVQVRRLARAELARVGEIDRTERIALLYEQHGTELVERPGNWDASPWDPDGHGDHSVERQRRALEHDVSLGGIAVGAFVGVRLVGIGVVVPHLRPALAQLAFLHVTQTARAAGIGSRLVRELEHIARDAGDSVMVVSATPSANTVRFYRGRGFELMAVPLPELVERVDRDGHGGLPYGRGAGLTGAWPAATRIIAPDPPVSMPLEAGVRAAWTEQAVPSCVSCGDGRLPGMLVSEAHATSVPARGPDRGTTWTH